MRAGSFASLALADYQAIHFGAQRHFEQARNADVQPADDFALLGLGNEDGIVSGRLQLAEPNLHLARCRRIAQFRAENRETWRIADSCATNLELGSFGLTWHRSHPFPVA